MKQKLIKHIMLAGMLTSAVLQGNDCRLRNWWEGTTASERLLTRSWWGSAGCIDDVVRDLACDDADVNFVQQDLRRQISDDGRTSLLWAAVNGDAKLVELLLAHGADIERRTLSGFTALHEAVWQGHLAVAQILVANGADMNAASTNEGLTPLHVAINHGSIRKFALLFLEADWRKKSLLEKTPIDLLVERGEEPILRLLNAHDIISDEELNEKLEASKRIYLDQTLKAFVPKNN